MNEYIADALPDDLEQILQLQQPCLSERCDAVRNAGHPAFKTIADAQKKLSGEQDRLGRTKKQHTMLKERIDKDKAQLKQLAGAGENLLRLTSVKEKAEQRLKDLSSLV